MTKAKTECPKNSEIKNAIVKILDGGDSFTSKELKTAVTRRMRLNQDQLTQPTESGKGIRFNIRFSVQLSELVGKDLVEKVDGQYRKVAVDEAAVLTEIETAEAGELVEA